MTQPAAPAADATPTPDEPLPTQAHPASHSASAPMQPCDHAVPAIHAAPADAITQAWNQVHAHIGSFADAHSTL